MYFKISVVTSKLIKYITIKGIEKKRENKREHTKQLKRRQDRRRGKNRKCSVGFPFTVMMDKAMRNILLLITEKKMTKYKHTC